MFLLLFGFFMDEIFEIWDIVGAISHTLFGMPIWGRWNTAEM